ncbi:single-stranded DNA-binding protein [Mucilaginibacter ginkgonis]|uniref:Single-stranded DNA-binding protein n=1 Tax=Mucilaginibacter ginkgonis TaxID=2682091 RepID=A0A6I4HUG0_9SPHI|nr:single-stranded DNA-binding protein [Mucilaginibacter ginkgonis]QQL50215.1 single-stranded DNA-binding protein [Mucilaginibacter ginkgonis]
MAKLTKHSSVNRVILAGKIVNAPSIIKEHSNKFYHFLLQTTENINSGKGPILHNELHVVNYSLENPLLKHMDLRPGLLLYIQGSLRTNTIIDVDDTRHYRTIILATNIEIITI